MVESKVTYRISVEADRTRFWRDGRSPSKRRWIEPAITVLVSRGRLLAENGARLTEHKPEDGDFFRSGQVLMNTIDDHQRQSDNGGAAATEKGEKGQRRIFIGQVLYDSSLHRIIRMSV